MKDPALPPVFSGYPSGDRSGWGEFWGEYDRVLEPIRADLDGFLREHDAPSLPPREFMLQSPHLNLYVYPAEADYRRSVPLHHTWRRLDASVRATDDPFELPDAIGEGDGPIVYLSLGSLGSADVELMNRLLSVLGGSGHRVIVSMGPQHESLRLAGNMVGAEFLPQTSILPAVDVVITHGGNNTVTESFHFGKPMIALPLFWDQYDNAQRIQELGFGVRLDTYRFDERELLAAIDRLAGEDGPGARMRAISARLQASPGTVRAADLIEALARRSR